MNFISVRTKTMLKASDCNFIFCLPLNREAFEADNQNPAKHFVSIHLPEDKKSEFENGTLWEAYKEEVVQPYLRFKKQFSAYGFVFNENVTFNQFATLIHDYHVNIVFSHCRIGDPDIEAVEFNDKLVGIPSFLEAIPEHYDKTLDLSVCKPVHLAQALKQQRRRMVVKSASRSIGFVYWIYIYSVIFQIIHTQKIDYYSTAIEKAIFKINEK
jgi:hypothetical protein